VALVRIDWIHPKRGPVYTVFTGDDDYGRESIVMETKLAQRGTEIDSMHRIRSMKRWGGHSISFLFHDYLARCRVKPPLNYTITRLDA
jgi:hypothetical protein